MSPFSSTNTDREPYGSRKEAWKTVLSIIAALGAFVLAVASWVIIVAGLSWGIFSLTTNGPSFWNILVIVTLSLLILQDLVGKRWRA